MLSPDLIRILLVGLIALPFVTAVSFLLVRRSDASARGLAIASSLLHLVLTGLVVFSAAKPLGERHLSPNQDRNKQVIQPELIPGSTSEKPHETNWVITPLPVAKAKSTGVQLYFGLDGFNLWLVALSSIMMVAVVFVSLDTIRERFASYFAWLFVLQGCVLGVFLSFDLILFYIFFELTLVPLFFLIGNWGTGPTRRDAARKLFLFTLAGGLITLLGIASVVITVYTKTAATTGQGILTFSIPELAQQIQNQLAFAKNTPDQLDYWLNTEVFLLFTLIVGFAVKIPLVPLHSWLPGAYTQAPIGVTVMLSALLAKMGTFGLLRICLPLAPDAILSHGLPIIGGLAAVGIIYGALCAYSQSDFRGLVAYSSISHLGFCALGLLAFNATGIAGGALHMVNHGLSTGALFLLVGYLSYRYTSGQISDFSGMWGKLPVLTFFMMVMCLASVGLPGLNNFISEMLMLSSLFDLRNANVGGYALAFAAAIGIFLSAWYTITLLFRSFFGPLREPLALPPEGVKDLKSHEYLVMIPLAALCLVLGIYSQPVLNTMQRDVDAMTKVADEARARQSLPRTVSEAE